MLNILNDATCYVDDALHHQSGDYVDDAVHHKSGDAFQVRLGEARDNLLARIAQGGTETGAREQLVIQQVGLLLSLLPELTSRRRQIAQTG